MRIQRRDFVLFWQRLWQLSQRETKRRYKDTLLGWIWIVLVPVIESAVIAYVFVRIVGVRALPAGQGPYIFIVLSGFTVWNYVSHTIGQSMTAFTDNVGLVNYQPVPLILLPLANSLIKAIDFLVSLVIFTVLLLVIRGSIPGSFWLGILPLSVSLFMFVTSCAIFVALLGSLVRDFGHLISLILTVWFWISPIFYPAASIPGNIRILYLNPMIHFLAAFRQISLEGTLDPTKLAKLFVLSFVLLAGSLLLFRTQKSKVYDRP